MRKADAFIIKELWILSWAASVQRAHLFSRTSTELQRRQFRYQVISYLKSEVLPEYTSRVSEDVHYTNIQRVSDGVSSLDHANVLGDARYKIGVAQKLLNLQLKYLWCMGLTAEPPHCPIDRVIINKTPLRGKVAWTKITTLGEYRQVISSLKEVVDRTGLSIAQWELDNYDRADA